MSDPERFRLRADAMSALRRRHDRRFAATLLAATFLVVVAFVSGLRGGGLGGWGTLLIGLGLLAALATWSYRRRVRTFRARWESFTVALGDDAVSRTVEGHPEVRIARAEVAAVGEAPAGLVVRSRGGHALVVPREIEGYDRLRSALSAWGPTAAG